MSDITGDDARWMRRALDLAASSWAIARPNPHVGAVVVAEGVAVATGATQPPGGDHAEVMALRAAGDDTVGATLYVTLEPCAHQGRTPPCADAIVAAGITRVVIGMPDPNPAAAGGTAALRSAGIGVTIGVLEDQVADQLRQFVVTVTADRPHITLKLAQTTTGVTDPRALGSPWITGPAARGRVHGLRAGVDGVLVGSGTVLADDPFLTVRDAPLVTCQPRAIVWDRRGRVSADAHVVRDASIVVTGPDAPAGWRRRLAAGGMQVVVADDLAAGLSGLIAHDVGVVLAEPGPTLAGALVAHGVVDRMLVHVADTTLSSGAPTTWAVPVGRHTAVTRRQLGADVEWEFVPAPDQHLRAATSSPSHPT